MARSQKPFVVEVKRGRRGGVVTPFTVVSKAPDAALKTAAEASFAPPPEPPKPPRRILDAIEPEPEPATPEEEPVAADPIKRRRGRPPKTPGTPPSPRKQRPAVAERVEAPVLVARREFPPVEADRVAPPRKSKVIVLPQSPNHSQGGGRAPQPHLVDSPVTAVQVTQASVHHGHLTHDGRVEAATGLPRGERWKRRLPKVLW